MRITASCKAITGNRQIEVTKADSVFQTSSVQGLKIRPPSVTGSTSTSTWVLSPPDQNMITKFRASIFRRLIKITRLSLFGVLVACALSASCSLEVAPVKEAEYSATIVGEWFGTSMVGDMRESISFSANGSFVAHVRPVGSISNALGQGVTGAIGGTWAIKGKSITLSITSAEDERVLNKSTTSTIETFRPNELIVKSNTEGTSTLIR